MPAATMPGTAGLVVPGSVVVTSVAPDSVVVVMEPDTNALASWVVASTVATVVVGPTGSPPSEPSALVTPMPPARTSATVRGTERLIMMASLAEPHSPDLPQELSQQRARNV